VDAQTEESSVCSIAPGDEYEPGSLDDCRPGDGERDLAGTRSEGEDKASVSQTERMAAGHSDAAAERAAGGSEPKCPRGCVSAIETSVAAPEAV
jgi:hypothetical protein